MKKVIALTFLAFFIGGICLYLFLEDDVRFFPGDNLLFHANRILVSKGTSFSDLLIDKSTKKYWPMI